MSANADDKEAIDTMNERLDVLSADAEREARDKQLDALIDVGATIFAAVIDEGQIAIDKVDRIQAIIDDLMTKMPTFDSAVPWNALAEIRRVLR